MPDVCARVMCVPLCCRDVALAHIRGAERNTAQGRYLLMTSSAPAKLYARLFWPNMPEDKAAAHTPEGTNDGACGWLAPSCKGMLWVTFCLALSSRAAGAVLLFMCEGSQRARSGIHAHRTNHRRHGAFDCGSGVHVKRSPSGQKRATNARCIVERDECVHGHGNKMRRSSPTVWYRYQQAWCAIGTILRT